MHFTPVVSEQGLGRVTDLRVTHANSRRIRIAWTGVAGATGYRVTWRQGNSRCLRIEPELFGVIIFHLCLLLYSSVLRPADAEQSRLLGAATVFTIDGLQPDEALVIGVAAMVDQSVGEVATISSRTNPHGGSVSNLRSTDVTPHTIRVVWSPSSRATGYRITWRRDNGRTF